MSCCGEPKDSYNDNANRQMPPSNGYVTQQPGLQPGLEKPFFQPPAISSPPPVHTFSPNGYGQQSPWPQNSPSPPPGAQQPVYGHPVNGYSVNDPIIRPPSTHQATFTPPPGSHMSMSMSPPPLSISPSSPQNTQPSADEGKMSISIDFGEHKRHVDNRRFTQLS